MPPSIPDSPWVKGYLSILFLGGRTQGVPGARLPHNLKSPTCRTENGGTQNLWIRSMDTTIVRESPIGSMGRLYIYLHEWLIFLVYFCRQIYHGYPWDTGCWDQIFGVSPILGEDEPNLTSIFFSLGLVQPPTSSWIDNRFLYNDNYDIYHGSYVGFLYRGKPFVMGIFTAEHFWYRKAFHFTTINSVMKGRCEPRWLESFRVSRCSQFYGLFTKPLGQVKNEQRGNGCRYIFTSHGAFWGFVVSSQTKCDTTCFFSSIMFKFQVKNMIIFRPRLGFQLLKLAIMVLKVATPPLGKTVVSGGERLVAKGR